MKSIERNMDICDCAHPWSEHYKAGCYHVTDPRADEEGLPRRYCKCTESVNRLTDWRDLYKI